MATKRSLVSKLCQIMRAVSNIEKRGFNDLNEYAYATEGDVKEAFRAEFFKRRVFPAPTVLSSERHKITLSLRGGEVDTYITVQRVQWTFFDGDGDAPISCIVEGCGEDQGDKGVYKALTGSLKSVLMSSFLIRSGEDPDADSKTTAKDVRDKKVEMARAIGEAKANGTYAISDGFPLTYFWPVEYNRHYALFLGTDDALNANREPLMANGKFLKERKAYKVPAEKVDGLLYCFEQLKITVKELPSA